MSRSGRNLQMMTWPEIDAYLQRDDIVLLPIGATEQHGAHMPLMVDSEWAIAAADGAAEATNVLVTPPLYFGWSPHHLGYAGGLTLRAETLTQVAVDLGESLVHHGFKKIIIVNGNRVANLPPLEIAATKLRFTTGAYVAVADVSLIAKREIGEICESGPGGIGHAGESETSFMLYRHPDSVAMDKAVSVMPEQPQQGFRHWHVDMETAEHSNSIGLHPTIDEFRRATEPTGTGGDALSASREKGQRIYEALVKNLSLLVDQTRSIDVRIHAVPTPV